MESYLTALPPLHPPLFLFLTPIWSLAQMIWRIKFNFTPRFLLKRNKFLSFPVIFYFPPSFIVDWRKVFHDLETAAMGFFNFFSLEKNS